MGGVTSVTQLTDHRLEGVAEIAGVRRQWEARIVEQVPDRKVSWAATSGATNAGTVSFEPAGEGQTHLHLHLEYEPEGLVETVGDKLGIVEKQAQGDLERFAAFIESEDYATGAWRGTVNPGANASPDLSDASSSEGDSGKARVSKTAVVAGVGLAAAAATVAATVRSGSEETVGAAETTGAETPVDTPVAHTAVVDTVVADTPPVGATDAVPGDEANQI